MYGDPCRCGPPIITHLYICDSLGLSLCSLWTFLLFVYQHSLKSWSVCPFGIPGSTELIYLNPRNIHIPQYHRLSVVFVLVKKENWVPTVTTCRDGTYSLSHVYLTLTLSLSVSCVLLTVTLSVTLCVWCVHVLFTHSHSGVSWEHHFLTHGYHTLLDSRVDGKCCLLWVYKARAKDKTYIWLSARWKTKT